jgi:hypothetical protein
VASALAAIPSALVRPQLPNRRLPPPFLLQGQTYPTRIAPPCRHTLAALWGWHFGRFGPRKGVPCSAVITPVFESDLHDRPGRHFYNGACSGPPWVGHSSNVTSTPQTTGSESIPATHSHTDKHTHARTKIVLTAKFAAVTPRQATAGRVWHFCVSCSRTKHMPPGLTTLPGLLSKIKGWVHLGAVCSANNVHPPPSLHHNVHRTTGNKVVQIQQRHAKHESNRSRPVVDYTS